MKENTELMELQRRLHDAHESSAGLRDTIDQLKTEQAEAKRQYDAAIAEMNERLIDRQQTLMAALSKTRATGAVVCDSSAIRYLVDVQCVTGRWENVENRSTEEAARGTWTEWKEWLTENRKTWKDVRLIKVSKVQEVLQTLITPDPPASSQAACG